ncbi:heparanase [Melitaea cinxia]|uniref:heparanase n=1 Tax=Melitaea cinxia TaxID=113334 RepID=UPI001E270E16|nr:heparanase [Melitaea cinxia]
MDRIYILLHIFIFFVNILHNSRIGADTYNVKIATEQHINLVDSKFLSFTIDPKYLFSSSEKYKTKECICMASALTPAYIRIAGPSTSHMTFKNSTIAIDTDEPRKLSRYYKKLTVTHKQWEKFVHWTKNTGFNLVFALNNNEKTSSGMWDPNTALKILTVADQSNVGEIIWQLGYECRNQSIEEYLNDLETLRVIIETYAPGRDGLWKVVGGDVTHCLQADSKSDFKDYVTLSNDMLDAIMLNGNSSYQELERMSERDRLKLLKLLSQSDTPLWLTEQTQMLSEFQRATDWMISLGYSARNGFSIHYRELMENELYEPTLSFYMALLYKNLVGERVLRVDSDTSQATVFAHCTSARRGASGAVTVYSANVDDEPARFSIKMTSKEDGGDMMQFILSHDHNGNIIVNNRAMYYEGDIRPVVKRIRPYKVLLLNLPPKSFGFWVLASTQVQACFNLDKKLNTTTNINTKDKDNLIIKKRSLDENHQAFEILKETADKSKEFVNDPQNHKVSEENIFLKERIESINKDLRKVQRIFQANVNSTSSPRRVRRQILDSGSLKSKLYNLKRKYNLGEESLKQNIREMLSRMSKGHISKIRNKYKTSRNSKRSYRSQSKRNSKGIKICEKSKIITPEPNTPTDVDLESGGNLVRKRRHVKNKPNTKYDEQSSENEITYDSKEKYPIGKIFHKLKKINDLPLKIRDSLDDMIDIDDYDVNSAEGIVLKTKLSDDSAVIDISDKSHTGLIKSTVEDILTLLAEFNKNINKFWASITLLE